MTDRARPGLVALYDIRPGNGAGQFLQPQSLHGAYSPWWSTINIAINFISFYQYQYILHQ